MNYRTWQGIPFFFFWRAYKCPAKFKCTWIRIVRRSLEELMWSEGKAHCRQESRSERAERMVTGGGESATPSRKTSGAKTVETGKSPVR